MHIPYGIRWHFHLRAHELHMVLHVCLLESSSDTIFIGQINLEKPGLIRDESISSEDACQLLALVRKWIEVYPVHRDCCD